MCGPLCCHYTEAEDDSHTHSQCRDAGIAAAAAGATVPWLDTCERFATADECHRHFVFDAAAFSPLGLIQESGLSRLIPTTRPCVFVNGTGPCATANASTLEACAANGAMAPPWPTPPPPPPLAGRRLTSEGDVAASDVDAFKGRQLQAAGADILPAMWRAADYDSSANSWAGKMLADHKLSANIDLSTTTAGILKNSVRVMSSHYTRHVGKCVSGNNLVVYQGQTVKSCIAYCDAYGPACLGFEFGMSYAHTPSNPWGVVAAGVDDLIT